ncbi:MAG: hypothetical protein LRS41_00800 [Caldisphaeraceae archaeon]|nr:hypothetical protein [Caldisphaeraceae archaeon]
MVKMRIPLDKICVKSGILCDNCQMKIDKGLYEKWEVDVMKSLLELEDKYKKETKDLSYKKSIIFDSVLYVIMKNIKGGRREIERYLEKELKNLGIKKVVLVEYAENPKELIYNILDPVKIDNVSIYYSPDGSIYYIVEVPSYEKGRLRDKEDAVKRIFKVLTKKDIYFELIDKKGSFVIRKEEENFNQHLDTEKLSKLFKEL